MPVGRVAALLLSLVVAGCSSVGKQRSGPGGGGDGGAGGPTDLAGLMSMGDGGATMSCMPDLPDQAGCACAAGTTRACYPASADAKTRGVGLCKDGSQTCQGNAEFPAFTACAGATTPVAENCSDGLDNNCDGKIDCADPTCATDAACKTGCTDGQTRPCYDGPQGTQDVGTCHGGMQTCSGGMWPSNCPGEALPGAENCSDALDHNCNHLPGCLDLFACITSPACMQQCTMPLDAGCVCPTGSGDTATCPEGMIGKTKGGGPFNPQVECCPCAASDCTNAACCAETVCAGNSNCSPYTCKPLPASCNGQVNFDCDDFPEDCDEPCCKCTTCP